MLVQRSIFGGHLNVIVGGKTATFTFDLKETQDTPLITNGGFQILLSRVYFPLYCFNYMQFSPGVFKHATMASCRALVIAGLC